MLERFTKSARAVVVRAREEARERNNAVGTEYLLLAMAELPGPVQDALVEAGADAAAVRAGIERRVDQPSSIIDARDAEALRSVGIDPDAVLAKIEESFGPGAVLQPRAARRGWFGRRTTSGRGTPPGRFSPRGKKVLEYSVRESVRLGSGEIAIGHLMLGLLREGKGLGAQILADAGVDLDQLRSQVELGMRRAA